MSNQNNDQSQKLLQIVRDAVAKDQALRDEFKIGDKFRFIRDRLQALLARVEENLAAAKKEAQQVSNQILEDEQLVYIYLYNAQGMNIKTWQNMLNPSVYYEYSVNRPIYPDKTTIEAYIRSKANKNQHGYISVCVKKQDILKTPEVAKDPIGNELIKVKEGSLGAKKMIAFTHNGQDYILNEEGEMVKKRVN